MGKIHRRLKDRGRIFRSTTSRFQTVFGFMMPLCRVTKNFSGKKFLPQYFQRRKETTNQSRADLFGGSFKKPGRGIRPGFLLACFGTAWAQSVRRDYFARRKTTSREFGLLNHAFFYIMIKYE
ncbi:MAG: hypothetical protein IJ521_02395 [Schwartzia sp.]|nr:hypothetical protein [Schwartzia sp. (in: firmicutes)]